MSIIDIYILNSEIKILAVIGGGFTNCGPIQEKIATMTEAIDGSLKCFEYCRNQT